MSLPIRLISTDFDGTVHSDSEIPPIPAALELKLAQLQRQGVKWMINTGRDLPGLMETLARARLSIWPDYLGLVEREIYVREGDDFKPCGDWNARCTESHFELFARVLSDMPALMQRIHSRHHATLYEDAFSPLCMIAKNNAEADGIMRILEEYCASVPHLTAVRNDIYARLSHADYHKGAVAAEAARVLGISIQEIFVAGDHLNDLPMLDRGAAGFIAAPSNAIPEVKQKVASQGGYLSPLPCGHGVLDALQHFLPSL